MEKLELQSTCFENIKTLCVNYSKDSASRKTMEYLKKRLTSLENQWQDFENRHAQLLLEIEDKNIEYFRDDIYRKTQDMFVSTKTDITEKLASLSKRNVKFDLGGTSEHDGNDIQLLLNKQECNFNAIYRVMSKIDVATISERWELEDYFATLKSKWEPIDKLHWEIDFQLKGSNEPYYEMFMDIEQKYDELKKKINAKIWSTVHYQKSTPKIEIPEFSGNYGQWISFKDLFLEAIHKNPMINKAQKMQHLKTKLRGEAERLVQHLTISTENYNACWDILNQRYDNRRLQFTTFMNNMLSLPIIQHADSFNLKKMHDVITESMNGISNLITENAAQLLRLPRSGINASVSGIGSVSRECRGKLKITCTSIHSGYSFETQALILTKLTNNLPTRTFERGAWPHLENLKLADPDFNISRQIDLLLGADVYSEIILEGVLKGNNSSPVAQHTQIGWILCGKMKQTFNCHATLFNLEDLTKFWESEEIQNLKDIPKDDQCEQFYKETVRRTSDGKYIVKIPLVPDYEEKLGKSRTIAVSQFFQLERRLKKNVRLSSMYKQFMEEYADLGHMKPAPHIPTDVYFLPHHGVLRENSTTTKLRVVFNASQRTTSGLSLNDVMEKGANLQKDIQALILKWRTYKYAFTADIEKMYRCIWISKEQQHLQRIVWRDSQDHNLREYQLCTVTYGTKCAPWLAMRTLKQLAIDDGHKHPEAAKILTEECYVDDVISGHNDLTEAKKLQQSLIRLLKGGGMNLRKWTANDRAIVEDLHEDQISTQQLFDFKGEESTKTLGLGWNPNSDTFHFNWPTENSKQITKRSLLSAISKFYDPLGWLSPVTVKAKLLFQKLWISKLSWDDVVPSDIESEWLKLKTELPCVSKVTINRWIGDTQKGVELLGFCDASEKAYACVVYSKVLNEHGQPIITLLAARTRVTPLTQKTTLPRLELCGAQLLAELMMKIKQTFNGYNISTRAWSDSQVVLAWIQGETSKWETYVANRVTKIKSIIPAAQWRYVKSDQNPADCASRGLLPSKLMDFTLWWQGPELLTKQDPLEDISCTFQTNLAGINPVQIEKSSQAKNEQSIIIKLLNKCSSLTQVNRVIAWILRFITNMRNRTKSETPYLTTSELSAARKSIIIHAQQLQFDSEYKQLAKNETVSKKSAIYKLNPYITKEGIICVGGRLKHSNLPREMKNPIIIPHSGRFTQLLIEQAHSTTLHGGARLTLTYIRQRYWIVGGNRAVKNQLRRCVRCHRFNKTDDYQLMGDLPQQRITPCRPFTHTGVDFTGHVDVKHNKGRGVKTSKGYVAIFICMVTKAVHIELVSDLSTETFIAAFQRLCARRGTPKHMYSDCGTNFVGAAKVLRQEFEEFKRLLKPDLFNELAKLEVEWHFNAPAWPTAGGLWEAAVKSMKHHLRRVLGEQKLTYEEFITMLAKIEACLNSRPLCPLTEDPEEFYNCLTPGHFLTGSPILSMPLSDYNDVNNIDLRRRWQLTEHMFQQYWKNWSNDYLTTLQTRSKWNKPSRNIKDIYKLINVKARVTETYFLFEAHIPLVANDDFDIYKAIPLPVNIAKETTYVQLSKKYIAVNFKKNIYVSMSEDDLKYCMQQKSRNFLCRNNLPSFELHSKSAPCEAKLLSHHNSEPCDVEHASCKDAWIELQTQNSWLAICCETCPLRIICSNDVTSQTISSSSIVTLSQGCVLQSTDLTIYAQRQYHSDMKLDYELAAPTFDTSINKIVNLTYRYAPNILQSKITNQEIATIEQQIAIQRKNEVSLPTITSHDIHQYAICYFLLTAAIIAVLVVVGRNRCVHYCTNNAKTKTSNPPPEDIELQVIRQPEYQQEAAAARAAPTAAQTTKDLRLESRPGRRNIAFQFD